MLLLDSLSLSPGVLSSILPQFLYIHIFVNNLFVEKSTSDHPFTNMPSVSCWGPEGYKGIPSRRESLCEDSRSQSHGREVLLPETLHKAERKGCKYLGFVPSPTVQAPIAFCWLQPIKRRLALVSWKCKLQESVRDKEWNQGQMQPSLNRKGSLEWEHVGGSCSGSGRGA